jgi:ferredoxin-NADP reductase
MNCAGQGLSMSPVAGKGFAVSKLKDPSPGGVVLFATGSGISPVRALLEEGVLSRGQGADVRLYYGARTPARMAYQDRWALALF